MLKNKFWMPKRRAVSTVLGGFFFIIILAAAFAAFLVMMQVNTNFFQTQTKVSDLAVKKVQEQFTVAAAYDSSSSNRLCVNVKNTGSTPLEIPDVWVIGTAASNTTARMFGIDYKDASVAPAFSTDIVANTPITLTPGNYNIKVVTSSGVMRTTPLSVFSGSPDPRLNVTAFVYPENSASGQNVTLGMHVYNRGNTTLLNVQPADGFPTVTPAAAVTLFKLITPSSISRLEPHENALFMWDPTLTGGVGSKLPFSLAAKAKVEGCTTSSFITSNVDSRATVKIVPGVAREILASPATFITFPNPMGESTTGSGVWALVIQNPTNHAFKVPQVSIQIISPTNPSVFSAVTGVSPAPGWTIAGGNTILVWHGTPVTVNPFDIVQFIVRATPTTTLSNVPINTIIFNVYSDFGQFGKGPFTAGSNSTSTTILNVYANTTFATGGAERFTIPNILSGTNQRFNFTISNFGATAISSGSYMLINIPPGLRDIRNVTTTPGQDGLNPGLSVLQMLSFDDGSSQIPVKLTADLAAGNKRSYSFRATIPTVSVPAFYTFTTLANGTVTNSMIVGPFSETMLKVCPTSGC